MAHVDHGYETAFYANNGKDLTPRAEQHGRFLGSLAHSYFYKSPAFYTPEGTSQALEDIRDLCKALEEPEESN